MDVGADVVYGLEVPTGKRLRHRREAGKTTDDYNTVCCLLNKDLFAVLSISSK